MKISVSKYISVSEDGKTEYTTVYRYGNNKYEISSPHYTSKAEDMFNLKKYLKGQLFDEHEDEYHEAKKRVLDNLLKIEGNDHDCDCKCGCKDNLDTCADEIKALNNLCDTLRELITFAKELKEESDSEDNEDAEEKEEIPPITLNDVIQADETINKVKIKDNTDKWHDISSRDFVEAIDAKNKITDKQDAMDYELGVLKDMVASLKAEIDSIKE